MLAEAQERDSASDADLELDLLLQVASLSRAAHSWNSRMSSHDKRQTQALLLALPPTCCRCFARL